MLLFNSFFQLVLNFNSINNLSKKPSINLKKCIKKNKVLNINYNKNLNNDIDQEFYTGSLLGLGLWRIRPILRPILTTLAGRVEAIIRQCCFEDGLDVDQSGGFEYWDTLDQNGTKDALDPFFATDVSYPLIGEQGYPRFQVENRLYKSRVFRKIHIELAARQDGLQIFHLVLFPKPSFDIPLLCMDVVTKNENISLAIVDIAPVRWDKTLPSYYSDSVKLLTSQMSPFKIHRKLPSWYEEICSHVCVSVKPSSDEEIKDLFKYACSLARLHLEVARLIAPVNCSDTNRLNEIAACHRRFCDYQIKNDKTRKILAASFGESKADKYMREFMFSL
jgi:phycocyanobilin:ferredoxin oxidoreductase